MNRRRQYGSTFAALALIAMAIAPVAYAQVPVDDDGEPLGSYGPAAGAPELGPLDVLVLHSVNDRERPKKLADLCFVLNIEEAHTVTYALKKLLRLGLITASRQGKERFYGTNAEGRALCARYREVREDCLVAAFGAVAGGDVAAFDAETAEAAGLMRALSGLYDQAARSATSL